MDSLFSHYECAHAPRRLKAFFHLDSLPPALAGPDVHPGDTALIVRQQMGHRLALPAFWGLGSAGPRDGAEGAQASTVQAEAIAGSPALHSAFKRRRCLVPVTALTLSPPLAHELPGERPHLASGDGKYLALAGLWESWHPPGSAETVDRFAIISARAHRPAGRGPHRLPVVLDEADWDIWLDSRVDHLLLQPLLQPCPPEWLIATSCTAGAH